VNSILIARIREKLSNLYGRLPYEQMPTEERNRVCGQIFRLDAALQELERHDGLLHLLDTDSPLLAPDEQGRLRDDAPHHGMQPLLSGRHATGTL
jgi:hypothetical protein